MAKHPSGYLEAWKNDYFEFRALPDKAQRMLRPMIEKIVVELRKETKTEEDLINTYFHNYNDILGHAMGINPRKINMRDSPELAKVENMAYYTRYLELKSSIKFKNSDEFGAYGGPGGVRRVA